MKTLGVLTDGFKSIFGSNLICVLLLGSVQKQDTTLFSDIDLICVIRKTDQDGIRKMRQLIKESEKLVDICVIYQHEIPIDPNNFRIGSHGSYQLELVYKKADCLYGKNIFLDFPSPEKNVLRRSIFEKIAEYNWWMRRLYIESNRERSIYSNYQINSRLIKMVRDYLFLSNKEDIHSTAEMAITKLIGYCPDLFNQEEKDVLEKMVKKELMNENAANMSDGYLDIRLRIADKLYVSAIKTMQGLSIMDN